MTDAPRRIQRLRTKGWKMPAGAVYVGRPSPFGNRCKIEQVDGVGWCITDTETGLSADCGTLAAAHISAVARFRATLAAQPDLVERIRRDLRGKTLCCYCPPHLACHPACAHWSRLPYGSGGYKAGRCALTGHLTLAPHGCDAWAERPIDWTAWGLSPPAPRPPAPPPITVAEAAGATQAGLFDG